ncbi:MAG TPA: hypothetical protein VFF67_01170 [Thermoplasmata archaeon]|nr:hypothetical protein [Thermoplasmata archaeon]
MHRSEIESNRARAISRRRRRAIAGGGNSALAVALLMTLASATTAAAGPVTIKAPYKGVVLTKRTQVASQGLCGIGKLTPTPNFNATAGTATFGDAARTCSKGHIYNAGYAATELSIWIPVKIKASKAAIVENWSVNFYGSEKLPGGVCSSNLTSYSCYQFAGVSFWFYSGLIDDSVNQGFWAIGPTTWPGAGPLTNSSSNSTGFTSGTYTYSSTHNVNGSISWNGPVTFFFNSSSLNATHRYYLIADFNAWALVYVNAGPLKGASGAAYLNMGTLGYGARLLQISIA